jgi:hypothetical protein
VFEVLVIDDVVVAVDFEYFLKKLKNIHKEKFEPERCSIILRCC